MIVGNNWFCLCVDSGIGFFRFCGYGLWLGSYSVYPMLFSERNRHFKTLKIGRWRLKVLTPWRGMAFLSKPAKWVQ